MLQYPNLSNPVQNPHLQIAKPNKIITCNLIEAYDINLKQQLIGTNELNFKIPYQIDKDYQLITNPHISQLKNRYLIKFTLGSYVEWFIIDNPSNNLDDDSDFLSVQAYSLEYELSDRYIRNYHPVSILLSDVVNIALLDTAWVLGSIPDNYNSIYRAFDISSESILSFILEIAEKYNLIAQFNTSDRQIDFYTKTGIGQNKGLVLSETKYLKTISDSLDNTKFCTRLKMFGKDNITIAKYNPTGKIYIEDYTYFLNPFTRDIDKNVLTHSDYWSDELCQAELDYQQLVSSKVNNFNLLREQLTTYEETLSTQQSELNNLNAQLEAANNNVQTALSTNLNPEAFIIDDIPVNLYTLRISLISQINFKAVDIIITQGNITSTQESIDTLQSTLKLSTFFSPTLLAERNQFIIEKELTESAYINEKDLFGFALTKLEEMKIPPTQIKIGIVNFLECIGEQNNWDKIVLGDTVTVKHSLLDINVSSQIIEADFNFENSDIQLTISNISKTENEDQKLSKLFYRANAIGSLVDINKSEWSNALSSSQNYSDSQTQELNKALLSLAVNTNIASEDGYITLAESQTLKTSLEQLKAESNQFLDLELEGIEEEQSGYSTALTNLETELNKWIGKNYYPIYITFNQRNVVNALFQGVQNTKSILINKITAIREIDANGYSYRILHDFVTNTYNLTNNSIPSFGAVNVVANSDGTVTVSWSGFFDDVSEIVGYNIWRATDSIGTNKLIVGTATQDVTSFVDKTTVHNTTYYYCVSAYNKVNNESELLETGWNSIIAIDEILPDAPENINAIARLGRIDITWDKSPSNNVVGYVLEKSINGGVSFSILTSINTNSYTEYDITISKETICDYRYRVKAINIIGLESLSAISSTPNVDAYQPADGEPPNTPNKPTISSGYDGSITINWTHTNPSDDLAKYRIYRSTNGDDYYNITEVEKNTLQYLDTGLINKTIYYYKVSSVDYSGMESNLSTSSDGILAVDEAPPNPPNPIATGDFGAIKVTWTEVNEKGVIYEVWRCEGSIWSNEDAIKIASVAGSTSGDGKQGIFVDYDPPVDTAKTYIYKLKAVDLWGNTSEFSENSTSAESSINFNGNINGIPTSDLINQIDGKIETWFQEENPNTWTEEDRPKHNGDMWYNPSTKLLKRYRSVDNTWKIIEDQKAIDAYALAEGKRTVFYTTVTTVVQNVSASEQTIYLDSVETFIDLQLVQFIEISTGSIIATLPIDIQGVNNVANTITLVAPIGVSFNANEVTVNNFPSAPYQVGDLWDNGNCLRICKVGRAAGSCDLSDWDYTGVQYTADSKIKTFYQPDIPISISIGDYWIDIDDDNHTYRAACVGANKIAEGQWESIRDKGISSVTFIIADKKTTKNSSKADYIVPTGSTSAQTTINNAISNLPDNGGTILLLEGTYIIDGSIVLHSHTQLTLSKGTTLKLKDNCNNYFFNILKNSDTSNGNIDIVINGEGIIDGNNMNQSSINTHGIQFVKTSFVKIYGISIINCCWYGMLIDESNNININNISCNNNFYSGLKVSNSNNIIISDNNVKNNSRHGIEIYGINVPIAIESYGNIIKNNNFKGNSQDGIYCECDNILILNNNCMENIAGIELSNECTYSNINNNICKGNEFGIWSFGNNSIINENILSENNKDGILYVNNSYGIISNNICQKNGENGICFYQNNLHNIISNNNCKENSQSTHNVYSNILIDGFNNYNNIQNNICRKGDSSNKPKYGICINSSSNNGNIVSNNDLYDSGVTGNFLDSGTGTVTSAGNRI